MGRFLDMQPRRPDRAAHGYVYYRWTTAYVRVVRFFLARTGRRGLLRSMGGHLERTHHAKVVPAEEARRVIRLDHAVDIREAESVVPFPVARDVVLTADPVIAVTECACRAAAEKAGDRAGHDCGPIDVCLYVGDSIASFVVEKQQPAARFVTRDEALGILDRASARGNIHTLWFKDAAAGRMYAICNCCGECCIGLRSQRAGFHPLAGSGYVARVAEDLCTACGACVGVCAFGALSLAQGAVSVRVDPDACMGCGACGTACPTGALALAPAEGGVEPLIL